MTFQNTPITRRHAMATAAAGGDAARVHRLVVDAEDQGAWVDVA